MKKVERDELLGLAEYEQIRQPFFTRMIAEKRVRRVLVADEVSVIFENHDTALFQIQEMLRTERIFEPAGIEEELDSYNPLIPDGSNLKATLLIEYTDAEERHRALERLKGLEQRCWLCVGDEKVFAIADEDLERENDTKTSAVHFLRFELEPAMSAALHAKAALAVGIDHENYRHKIDPVSEAVRHSLAADLN